MCISTIADTEVSEILTRAGTNIREQLPHIQMEKEGTVVGLMKRPGEMRQREHI